MLHVHGVCVRVCVRACVRACMRAWSTLDSNHYRLIRLKLCLPNRQRWGDTASVTLKVAARRLEWLGHLAQMPEHRLPKKCLFG